ncbi:hypothetical protein B0H14DRAFT_3587146 [Mycena olivaceomarginata]|nr:hypothetical protein B0H14DRAFT_3587146 [Mycena olivaceomarginata]
MTMKGRVAYYDTPSRHYFSSDVLLKGHTAIHHRALALVSDRDLYSRLLLAKGHGYPLSYPQPPDDLPPESSAEGIQIGDVGVLTSDGGFDPLFNICRLAQDDGNRFGVPAGFETVHLRPGDVSSRRVFHRPGSHVSNTRINKRRLGVDTDLDNVSRGSCRTIYGFKAGSGASVTASRINLRFLDIFRQQALRHAPRWYAFLKSLGYMVQNGELYLVTGLDNSSSWIVGAVETESQDCNISLKLKAAQIGSAGASYAWQWETSGAFADSGPRRPPGENPSTQNQTAFLRGFRIAVRSVAWTKISQAIPVVDSKRLTFFSRAWFNSFVQPRSLGSIAGSTNTDQHNSQTEEADAVEFPPATTRPYHPADAINNYLLNARSLHVYHGSKGMIAAATHDDEWISAIAEHETTLPAEAELIKRIEARCTIHFAYDGVYFRCNAAKPLMASSTLILLYPLAAVLCTLLIIPILEDAPSTIISIIAPLRYVLCALVSAGLIIYVANRQRPSHKLGRVERAVEACEETLKNAKSNCARNHVELTEGARRLLE